MNQLYNTYKHYRFLEEKQEQGVQLNTKCIDIPDERKKLKVSIRDLEVYKSYVDDRVDVNT